MTIEMGSDFEGRRALHKSEATAALGGIAFYRGGPRWGSVIWLPIGFGRLVAITFGRG